MRLIILIAMLTICSCAKEVQSRNLEFIPADEFQQSPTDTKFNTLIAKLDLNAPEFKYEYKNTGTSLGFKIIGPSGKVGKWVPRNAAADPESQVVSYELAKFLYMSELVVPSAYYTIEGRAINEFSVMVNNAKEKYSLRIENQKSILDALAKNPISMFGVFTVPVKNFEAVELEKTESNTINSDHPLAKFIRAEEAMPSADKKISLKGVRTKEKKVPTNTELELARELSKIIVMDVLMGQWDRWSGGNMEATYNKDTNQLHLLARDNGGASMIGSGNTNKNLSIVSRFDRGQIQKVQRLQRLLQEDPVGVAQSLQMLSKPNSLIKRVAALLQYVNILEQKFGSEKVYFPD